MRVPPAGDHRGNVHIGGTVEAVELADADDRPAFKEKLADVLYESIRTYRNKYLRAQGP